MKEPGLKGRKVMFKAFKLVHMEPAADDKIEVPETFFGALTLLERLGFGVVEHELARAYSSNPDVDSDLPDQIINVMNRFSDKVETLDYPVDGLVVASDDTKLLMRFLLQDIILTDSQALLSNGLTNVLKPL